MVEETYWRDSLSVPTQEWLREHSEWYEEPEENPVVTISKGTLIVGVATVILIIVTLLQYGGF